MNNPVQKQNQELQIVDDKQRQQQPNQSRALIEIEQSRAVQEAQAAMIVAKKFPRDILTCIDRIKQTCRRVSLAEKAIYSYPKGGKKVNGPSIRLAEAIAQNWGNITFGIRELEQQNGASTVEAFAWDLETNTKETKVFQIKHWRDTKEGGYAIKDQRDIYELIANQGARRLRSCILAIIPSDIVQEAEDECIRTLKNANKDVSPEKIKNMLAKFEAVGITKSMIEKRVLMRAEKIDAPTMISLGEILNSIEDGMSAIADWFDVSAINETDVSVAGAKQEEKKPDDKAKQAQEPQAEEAAEVSEGWKDAFDELKIGLENCKTLDDVTEYLGENETIITDMMQNADDATKNAWREINNKKLQSFGRLA